MVVILYQDGCQQVAEKTALEVDPAKHGNEFLLLTPFR